MIFFSDLGFCIFKEVSCVIYSVHFKFTKCYTVQFILPNVTDCQPNDHAYAQILLKPFQN